MKIRKRALAALLAAVMAVTGALLPTNPVQAEESQAASQTGLTEELPAAPSAMTEEEIEEAAMAADGVEITHLPEADGDYLVYMKPEAAGAVSIQNEVQEIAAEAPEVIVEADLSAAEARELKKLSSQTEAVYIEENIYLDGASADGIPKETDTDDFDPSGEDGERDMSFLDDMSALRAS